MEFVLDIAELVTAMVLVVVLQKFWTRIQQWYKNSGSRVVSRMLPYLTDRPGVHAYQMTIDEIGLFVIAHDIESVFAYAHGPELLGETCDIRRFCAFGT